MNKISLRTVSEFLSEGQMKKVVGGYDVGSGSGSGGSQTGSGSIVGCNWSPNECWCTVDILPDGCEDSSCTHCYVSADYGICMEACGADPCHILG